MIEPLTDLALIWAAVFVAVIFANKTRLTPVLFFLAMGAIFVNTDLLPEESHPFIRGFSELGIIAIMFALSGGLDCAISWLLAKAGTLH